MGSFLLVAIALLQCNTVFGSTVIDGEWAPWGFVTGGECSASCAGGVVTRRRLCENPRPANGGKDCVGEATMVTECNTQPCIDSGLSTPWGEWGQCDMTCGRGKVRRQRRCVEERTCFRSDKTVETRPCNTWNRTTCPAPCEKGDCPTDAQCEDVITELDGTYNCKCIMGKVLSSDKTECIGKPPTTTTQRPIPTLQAEVKTATTIAVKTASTVLIVFVSITLGVFIFLRIFTADRVIQMNMEIALLIAHLLLLVPYSSVEDQPMVCRWIAIGLHYFFTACFAFLFLESLHMYSMVAYVVPKDGLLGKVPNVLIGWGLPGFVIMFSLCFHYEEYGSSYHCWLDWNKIIVYAEMVPILLLALLTLIMTEAAGAADYTQLPDYNRAELFSAKISQRANLVLLPLILASWIVGFLSEYEQNIGLYSTFTILNTVIGVLVFFFHSTGNERVREKLKHVFSCCVAVVKSK